MNQPRTRFMTRRMWIMLIATLLVFGLVFGVKALFSYGMNKAINEMKPPAVAVSTATARTDSWARSLEAVGTIRAVNGVDVTTQIAGEVAEIHFTSGQRVKADDLLVTLEGSADQAQYEALAAAARLARLEANRYAQLYEQGTISESELDRARSEAEQAEGNARAQQQRLSYKTLRAPFAGQLGIRQVDLGQYLNPGDRVVSLVQLKPIHVNFSLPEQHIDMVRDGLAVRVILGNQQEKVYQGKVTAVAPGVDPVTRNFDVQATLPNEDLSLRPGMFATVEIRLPGDNELVVIPRTAVSFAPYGNSVYVVQEKAAAEDNAEEGSAGEGEEEGDTTLVVKRRFVKLGPVQGDLIAVTEGLQPGEVVATSGLLKLRNDAEVTIENDVKPADERMPTPPNT